MSVDGFEFTSNMICFNLLAAPIVFNPEPAPPATCNIQVRTQGRQKSNIDSRTHINPSLITELGEYENPVSDGWWWFFFEVVVTLPAGAQDRAGWFFNQSMIRDIDLMIRIGDTTAPKRILGITDPFDRGLAMDPRWTELRGGRYFWIDEPATGKRQTADNGKIGQVESGFVQWRFTMSASHADPRRSCRKEFTLTIRIEDGRKKDWRTK